MTNRTTFVALIILGLALLAPSAIARCGGCLRGNPGPYAFGHGDWNNDMYPDAYVVTHTTNLSDLGAAWWAFNCGDPRVDLGHDNGRWQADNGGAYPGTQPWLYSAYPYNGRWFTTGGSDGGCIDNCPEIFTPWVLSVSDQLDGIGYFMVTAANRSLSNPTRNHYDFAQAGIDQVLVPIPKPNIVRSQKLSATQTSVTIRNVLSEFQAGYYPQPGVTQTAAQVLTGYKVYGRIVPRGSPAPTDRSKAAGWQLMAGPAAMGTEATFTVDCAEDSDTYLALAVVFDGATPFETAFVGPNSTRIQCGPTLAEPPRFKVIRKKPPRRAH